jgi:vacuolar-type H+-ATPase subunit H
MEQLAVIQKIKIKEQEVEGIIEEAKRKAASMMKEAKLIKREQILKAAQEEALKEVRQLKEEFKQRIQEAIKKQELETKENITKIRAQVDKNKERAKDYIVDEVLRLWQLPR